MGAINAKMSRFFPAGFYYKTFLWPRSFWEKVYEPIVRQAAGLGKAPKDKDADSYEHLYAFADVLVVGGGVAGLTAALEAGRAGAQGAGAGADRPLGRAGARRRWQDRRRRG